MEEAIKKQVWRRFVEDGAIDSTRLNKRIIESWYFCRRSGVNPYDGKGVQLLSLEELEERQKANNQLMEVSLPFLNNLHNLFKHTKSIILLVDPEGYVLKVIGESDALKYARDINFVEGIKWTEDLVGTNAIGTALKNEEAITVVGAEHYSIASQTWVCSAAPIKDTDGTLLGVLDLSTRVDTCDHQHMLGAVVTSAYAIEYEWQHRMKKEDKELLEIAQRTEGNVPSSVFCNCKDELVYIHSSLQPLLASLNKKINRTELEEMGYTVMMKLPVISSISGRFIGYQLCLTEIVEGIKSKPSIPNRVPFVFHGVTGVSSRFRSVLRQAEQAAKTNIPVHLTGETGTGKELFAKAIHENSQRKKGPFVELNCGTVPTSLLESELFGYVPGAFTGAGKTGYKGKLAQADGGTLFLDEIGEISHSMQVALLKVLENQRVTALGGVKETQLDFRLITATNKDLTALMEAGVIREDFYYRLFVYPIKLPALRERKEDIGHFIHWYCDNHHWNVYWSEEMIEAFTNFAWPGNIRQLFNSLDRIKVYYGGELPSVEELQSWIFQHQRGEFKSTDRLKVSDTLLTFREEIEKKEIQKALEKTNGKAQEAFEKLGMSRSTFYRKLKKYQL